MGRLSREVRLQLDDGHALNVGRHQRVGLVRTDVPGGQTVRRALDLRDLREGASRRNSQPRQLGQRQVLERLAPAVGPEALDPSPQGARWSQQGASKLRGVLWLARATSTPASTYSSRHRRSHSLSHLRTLFLPAVVARSSLHGRRGLGQRARDFRVTALRHVAEDHEGLEARPVPARTRLPRRQRPNPLAR
jgi:hypothetical protein